MYAGYRRAFRQATYNDGLSYNVHGEASG